MNMLVSLVLWFSCLISYHPGLPAPRCDLSMGSKEPQVRLTLEAKIHDQHYDTQHGTTMLRWNLTLTYKNLGTEPILLYKKSSLIYRSMISKSLKAARKGKYVEDRSSHFIAADAMRAAGFRDGSPEISDFVTLKPGESHSVQADYGVTPRRDSNDDDGLAPGEYFIQLRVATWYHYEDPKPYQEKWRSNGFLWSENMTSEPMMFTIQ